MATIEYLQGNSTRRGVADTRHPRCRRDRGDAGYRAHTRRRQGRRPDVRGDVVRRDGPRTRA